MVQLIMILVGCVDYLEAPSEYVIDKFDKRRFLEQHEDKSQFLSEFLETQMFQCFVDDRYGDAAKNTNLEVPLH